MSPAWIRTRAVKTTARNPRGRTYQVLYRRGGRGFPLLSAGTFKTDRDAKTRRDLTSGWLAAGLDPAAQIAQMQKTQEKPKTFAVTAEAFLHTRHDLAAESLRMKHKALDKVAALAPDLLAKPPADWTVQDAQTLVGLMVNHGLAPSTIDKYIGDVRQILDFADVQPNPARDRRVKLPAQVRAEVSPPSSDEVLTILRSVNQRLVLPLIVLEQTAMRVGELATLPWGDVDTEGCRFRLSRERTKTRHPRWVQVPGWLMAVIDGTCASEDRVPTRRVFAAAESTIRNGMARACRDAGIPLYSPHDLRHRRASLWHGQGVTTRDLMERGGWSRSEIAIDVYSHVMPITEIDEAVLGGLAVMTR